ncbi:MAG TPA: GGDEF domain-containing protein [Desulfobacterales bacterium]|nr:GGDEF domain-containing protein [Desulfobacterales bacterium]
MESTKERGLFMPDVREILERLRQNEEVARKFFEVEVSILSILNFKDLFERLLTEIREKFAIPYVWISLIQDNEIRHMLGELNSSELLRQRLNLIKREVLLALIGNDTRPVLINKDLAPYFKLFPQGESYLIRSLAIVPLTHNGEIIGTLNHGDGSPTRYQPGMDATLLERLAVKVSICISNVVAHEKIRLAASRDPLTGVLNRRVLERVLMREYERALRYNSHLSIIFLDVDDFKEINDTYGHDVGDHLLATMAEYLTSFCRKSDLVARYAGDEFVIILPSTKQAHAIKLVERLKSHFEENPVVFNGLTIPITASFGVASLEDKGVNDYRSILKTADQRLLAAKREKKKATRVISLEGKGAEGR